LVASLTDEELDAVIEAIQKMLATQAENAKVIEGTTAPILTSHPHFPHNPARIIHNADALSLTDTSSPAK